MSPTETPPDLPHMPAGQVEAGRDAQAQPEAVVPSFMAYQVADNGLLYPDEPTRFHRKDIERLFVWCSDQGASDITIQTGSRIMLKIYAKKYWVTRHTLDHSEVMEIVSYVHGSESVKGTLAGDKDVDFSYQVNPSRDRRLRYRVNVVGCTVNGALGAQLTARTIPGKPPSAAELGVEPEIMAAIAPTNGLVLVTGATGSGKSTLLASVIRDLLEDPNGHRKIITFEAPIEYVYDDIIAPTSSIAQTEVGKSLKSFAAAVRNALRRAPEIILIGEARDQETIGEVIVASQTGHLVYTTVHSNGFADTFSRMVNAFERDKNARAAEIIASTRLVISQRLVPSLDNKRVALREYVVINEDIVDFILKAGLDQMSAACRQVLKQHGRSFLQDATEKYRAGLISKQVWNEVARTSASVDIDAAAEVNELRSKIQSLSGFQSLQSKLEEPVWPADQPVIDLDMGLDLKPD